MASEKNILSGNTTMLILKLLEQQDMYGYQIIEALSLRSDETFKLKTGTLYPILHNLEHDDMVISYDQSVESDRVRKYYRLTDKGRKYLSDKEREWEKYASAVEKVLKGGLSYASC